MDVLAWLDNLTNRPAPDRARKYCLVSISTLGSFNSSDDVEPKEPGLSAQGRMDSSWSNRPEPTMRAFPTRMGLAEGDDNPYRLPGIASGGDQGFQQPEFDSADMHNRREGIFHLRRATAMDFSAICFKDEAALARLEGRECFHNAPKAEADWRSINFGIPLPGGPKPNYSNDTVPKRNGSLFRSLSHKVKGLAARKPSSARVSILAPPGLQGCHPKLPRHGTLHPDIKAIPIHEAQARRFRVTMNSSVVAPGGRDLRHVHANRGHPAFDYSQPATRAAHPSVKPINLASPNQVVAPAGKTRSKRPAHPLRRKAAPLPPRREQSQVPREVFVVGNPNRITQFGDFVDFAESANANSNDRSILDINHPAPLRPRRKPVPGGTTWIVSPRKPVTSNSMAEDCPAVNELCDRIDRGIAETARLSEKERGKWKVDPYDEAAVLMESMSRFSGEA